MKPVAVPASKIGQFYSGDCYIVLYSYRENAGHGKEIQIVYYWIVSSNANQSPCLGRNIKLDLN